MRRGPAGLVGVCVARAASIEIPEQRLCLAVVLAALEDAYNVRALKQDKRDAIAFLRNRKVLGRWTWPIGVDPEYVMRLIDEAHDYHTPTRAGA